MRRSGTIAMIDEAEARIATLRAIDSQLNLPRTRRLTGYGDAMRAMRDGLNRYGLAGTMQLGGK